MRKLLFVGVLVLAMSGLALAQDFPKFEVFGGYSYLRSDLNSNNPFVSEYYGDYGAANGSGNLNGFEASFTYNLNKWLGIKADFSGHFGKSNIDESISNTNEEYNSYYGSTEPYYQYSDSYKAKGTADVRHYTYMFGPEFSYRGNSKVRPFAHALFGVAKVDIQKLDVDWTELAQGTYANPVNDYSYYYIGNITGSFSKSSFAMALGGGLDINVNKKIAIRLAQIDYIPAFHAFKGNIIDSYNRYLGTSASGEFDYGETRTRTVTLPAERYNNLRLSTGIVFKF